MSIIANFTYLFLQDIRSVHLG